MLNPFFTKTILFSVCLSLPLAFACPFLGELKDSDKEKAEIVFEGTSTDYNLSPNKDFAKVTFKVRSTIKGEERQQWVVYITSNTNVAIPKTLAGFQRCYGKNSEVGIINSIQKNDSPIVIQGVCNPPYILPLGGSKRSLQDCAF